MECPLKATFMQRKPYIDTNGDGGIEELPLLCCQGMSTERSKLSNMLKQHFSIVEYLLDYVKVCCICLCDRGFI